MDMHEMGVTTARWRGSSASVEWDDDIVVVPTGEEGLSAEASRAVLIGGTFGSATDFADEVVVDAAVKSSSVASWHPQ